MNRDIWVFHCICIFIIIIGQACRLICYEICLRWGNSEEEDSCKIATDQKFLGANGQYLCFSLVMMVMIASLTIFILQSTYYHNFKCDISKIAGLTISGNGRAVLVNDPLDKKITVFERWIYATI